MKDLKLPKELEDFASSMQAGQMIPIPETAASQNISFLIRETDDVVSRTLANPMVALQAGHITFDNQHQLQILVILCRLSEIKNAVYETPFSCADDDMEQFLLAIEGKKNVQLLFAGDTLNSVVNVELPAFHRQVDASIQLIKSGKSAGWDRQEFLARIEDMQHITKTTNELWDMLIEHESFLRIKYR